MPGAHTQKRPRASTGLWNIVPPSSQVDRQGRHRPLSATSAERQPRIQEFQGKVALQTTWNRMPHLETQESSPALLALLTPSVFPPALGSEEAGGRGGASAVTFLLGVQTAQCGPKRLIVFSHGFQSTSEQLPMLQAWSGVVF